MPRASARRLVHRAGFTLLEMLIVLAVIALGSALAFQGAGRALDSSTTRTEAYNFQRQLLDLRQRAYREDRVFELRATPGEEGDPEVEAAAQQLADRAAGVLTDNDGDDEEDDLPTPLPVTLDLRAPYTYSLSEPIIVTPTGSCTNVTITLLKSDKPATVLQGLSDVDGCHLAKTG